MQKQIPPEVSELLEQLYQETDALNRLLLAQELSEVLEFGTDQ
jgi:hypothetical protein